MSYSEDSCLAMFDQLINVQPYFIKIGQNRKKRGGGAVNIERVYHQETDKADFIQRAMSAANNKTR